MRVWDHIASLTHPVRAWQTPFIADVRLLAEAAARRTGASMYVARDERHALMAASAARFFRPDLSVVSLPAWDCLPYDRISPSPAVAARRCAALARIAGAGKTPLLVVTTASAVVQRLPPRSHMAQASFVARVGDDTPLDKISAYLQINGYARASTVREPGEYSMRGGIVDIFPAGSVEPVRLDFFGDQLDVARYFDPETQRSTIDIKEIVLAPVSEIDFSDAALACLRSKFLAAFGSPGGDPTYEAARDRIRRQGVEQWLPLFYDKLETLFDYLGPTALIGLDQPALDHAAERVDQAQDYFEARKIAAKGTGSPAHVLPPTQLYLALDEFKAALAERPTVQFSSHDAPEKTADLRGRAKPGRLFVAERIDPAANLFDSVVRHIRERQATGKKVVIAAWSTGSANRLVGFLEDHGIARVRIIRDWTEASKADVSVSEIPVEAGFEDDDIALISEQDILGDKLARPRRRRSSAAVIAEAAALAAGDLIVHVDHGVGRYDGLKTVEVNQAPHDCLELVYAGGDKIFCQSKTLS